MACVSVSSSVQCGTRTHPEDWREVRACAWDLPGLDHSCLLAGGSVTRTNVMSNMTGDFTGKLRFGQIARSARGLGALRSLMRHFIDMQLLGAWTIDWTRECPGVE